VSGAPTHEGYANDLATDLEARWPGIQLVEVGCPGETTTTMLDGGDRCYRTPDSQLGAAVDFLRTHPTTTLVTVDLGFNDVRPCLVQRTVDEPCVEEALGHIRQQLPVILSTLRGASTRSVHLVGIDHYDPYLADRLLDPGAEPFAQQSLGVIDRLDDTLRTVYAGFGVPTADVPARFDQASTRPVAYGTAGEVPEDVARICTLTWMCQPRPLGPNPHPDAAGYQAIADAVSSALDGR
jgi:lysophospholipase L1-like esterase